jgi:hypothetical protein
MAAPSPGGIVQFVGLWSVLTRSTVDLRDARRRGTDIRDGFAGAARIPVLFMFASEPDLA